MYFNVGPNFEEPLSCGVMHGRCRMLTIFIEFAINVMIDNLAQRSPSGRGSMVAI